MQIRYRDAAQAQQALGRAGSTGHMHIGRDMLVRAHGAGRGGREQEAGRLTRAWRRLPGCRRACPWCTWRGGEGGGSTGRMLGAQFLCLFFDMRCITSQSLNGAVAAAAAVGGCGIRGDRWLRGQVSTHELLLHYRSVAWSHVRARGWR